MHAQCVVDLKQTDTPSVWVNCICKVYLESESDKVPLANAVHCVNTEILNLGGVLTFPIII